MKRSITTKLKEIRKQTDDLLSYMDYIQKYKKDFEQEIELEPFMDFDEWIEGGQTTKTETKPSANNEHNEHNELLKELKLALKSLGMRGADITYYVKVGEKVLENGDMEIEELLKRTLTG